MTAKTFTSTTDTVDNVIHCAAELFKVHGYKRTTVDDISSRVHISKKTLYAFFPSKEEILNEATWRDTMATINKFKQTIMSGAKPDAVLLSLCRFIFTDRIKKGKTGMFWGIHSEDSYIKKSHRNALKRVIVEIYDEGASIGIFKPVDPAFATELVASLICTSVEEFHKASEPVKMFNDALSMIADAVAYKARIEYDNMG